MFKKSFFAALLSLISLSSLAEVIIKDYPVDKISPSVFVLHGPVTVPNEMNQGFMNNPSFVLTSAGVVIIDPGGVVEGGEMLLRAIKKTSNLPVVAIFNTHVHADHWFGNAAIMKAYPNATIYAHKVTLEEGQVTGEAWVETVKKLTKSNAHKQTVTVANKAVNNGDVIKIGEATFTIYHDDVTHTQSDIMVSVNEGEALFMGDNLFNGRLNSHAEGHMKKTMQSIEAVVAKVNPSVIVPGHGQSGGLDMFHYALNAHKFLYQSVQKQYDDDKSDFEMKADVEKALVDYKHWAEFDNQLGKLINKAFLEIEEADF